MATDLDPYQIAGSKAFYAEQPEAANPYAEAPGSNEFKAWRLGWRQAAYQAAANEANA